jgi:protein-S-isoprenylcysteine O-methyltransferase Ste14
MVVTVLSFPFGPGLVVVLIPFLLTRFNEGRAYPGAVRILSMVLIVLGTGLMLASFSRFPIEASGTPFPTNPPSSRRVIVGGPYRYVRNPMYVSFAVVLVGMSLYLARPVLLAYLAVLLVLLAAFVRWYEEPTLARRFAVLGLPQPGGRLAAAPTPPKALIPAGNDGGKRGYGVGNGSRWSLLLRLVPVENAIARVPGVGRTGLEPVTLACHATSVWNSA